MVKRAHRGAEVFGLDPDPEALKLARTKLEEVGIEARLDQGLASALPYADESFDRTLSSLFFHHLPSELKLDVMQEVLRVLRLGGEFHIADWGKPTNLAMRLAFVGVQLLDGVATTTHNVRGLLPDLLGLAGCENVETTNCYSTLLGTLSPYRARKVLSWRVGWLLWRKNKVERDFRSLLETVEQFRRAISTPAILINTKLELLLTRGDLHLPPEAEEVVRFAYEKLREIGALAEEKLPPMRGL